jgi:hypothetical protein
MKSDVEIVINMDTSEGTVCHVIPWYGFLKKLKSKQTKIR